MRLALFIIVAMALLHKAGMSSRLDGFGSFSTSLLACVIWVCLVCWKCVVDDVLVFGLGSIRLAVFMSRVIRFNRLVPDFVMGVVLCLDRVWVVEP
jgi:hypothetical protein